MPYKPAICFSTADRRDVLTRIPVFCEIVRDGVYTRKCFSESEGTRFGGPRQKALPSMNEFTLLCFFACSFDVPANNL